jgi:hypothetical protein
MFEMGEERPVNVGIRYCIRECCKVFSSLITLRKQLVFWYVITHTSSDFASRVPH